MTAPGPPVLSPYDAAWPATARRLTDALGAVTPAGWAVEHIGSTSVPGLAAKDVVDLQLRVPVLPPAHELDELLAPTGFVPTTGSRPDSPGVHRDNPRGAEDVPDEVWGKRLFVTSRRPDAVLHVRRLDSPWGRHTIWFRDWLRAHDAERDRYEAMKRACAAAHAGDPDFDDYTRAKTAYFDEVQPVFEAWARAREKRSA